MNSEQILKSLDEYHKLSKEEQNIFLMMILTEIHHHDCELKEFGECSYSETGCSDCLVKAKIRKALSNRTCKVNSIDVSDNVKKDEKINDTISRQAAIDIVEFECGEWRGLSRTIVKEIEQLPSAQPEQSTGVQDILQYLDEYLHPIVSPEHWSVYSELYDMISMLPSAQPESYKDKLKEIADALSEKMCYMNTCPNERDIILGYLGRKRSSKNHCNTDCWNEKCESYNCETKQQQEPCEDAISRQDAIDALNEYFARIGKLKKRGLTKGEKAISLDTVGAIKSLPSAQQHGRVFKGIVVEYLSYNTYPEYKGKPYFSIKYTENGQELIGYGTYNPEVLSEYIKEYFMPRCTA